mmetsp:Transcript_33092/g.99683  ORF Transcript_33092/g.99683 Transcript_33092/m.99683 type:complete len:449 (+) Transcript_33092:49-1395(+)
MASQEDRSQLVSGILVDGPRHAPLATDSSADELWEAPHRKHWRARFAVGLLTAGLLAAALVTATATSVSRRSAAADGLVAGSGVELAAAKKVKEIGCHTVAKHERCYADVMHAMEDIDTHPVWYQGLNNKSTFKEFQNFLHTQVENNGERRCPKPCGLVVKSTTTPEPDKCHDAVPGEECYSHMVYTRKEAGRYPKWYPGLTGKSPLTTVQHYLEQENVCPEPCALVKEEDNTTDDMADCHTALPGESCFDDIIYAKTTYIHKHPELYPGLTNASSRDMFQAFLHGQSSVDDEAAKRKCPKPCDPDAVDDVKVRARCETAKEHDPCWESIVWGATVGMKKHPEWYGELTSQSSFEDFQLHLNNNTDTKCPKKPCPCHTHVEGDKCYDAVMYVLHTGLREHPKEYKGLTAHSSFEDVQAHLHALRTTPCLRPCMAAPWLAPPNVLQATV